MIPYPDVSEHQCQDSEVTILQHLLRDSNVDDITNRGESALFFDPYLRDIFDAAKEYAMTAGKGHVTYKEVIAIMQAKGKTSTSLATYLEQLGTSDITNRPTLDYVFDKLDKLNIRRQTIMKLYEGYTRAIDKTADITTVVAETEESLLGIGIKGHAKIEVIMSDALLPRRHAGLVQRRGIKPVYSGWSDFDKHLGPGYAPTKISIIAGRTSMGKSFFKTNLMANMGRNKIGIVNICPEQGFDSEHDRMDAILTGAHLRAMTRIHEAEPGADIFKKIKMSTEHIANNWNYACVPTRGITVPGVLASIRRARRSGFTPQVVFIDLFDRLDDVNVARDRAGTMSTKLNEIEKIAQDENVHICLLVQVNRGTESRKDKRPVISDLRDCGNFEQDADLVLLLYREGYYNNALEDNILEVIIAKQRDGNAGITYEFGITDKQTLSIHPIGVKSFATAGEAGT